MVEFLLHIVINHFFIVK